PRLRHDRGSRDGPPPRGARRHGLRLLFDRLPDPVQPRTGGLSRRPGDPRDGASMKFEGSVEIAAPRDTVWAFVIDPQQVGQCGPGVESIELVDDTHFKAVAKVGIGFISARFVVNMQMAEQDPPSRAVIKAHGQAPGSAVDATAAMSLSDGADG